MSSVRIHVGGTFVDTKRRVLEAVARVEQGQTPTGETHLTFESWAGLMAVMTPKRLELLRHVHRHPEASVAALARALRRDYKRVHEDVEALTAAGLLDRQDGGVQAEYDAIKAEVAL